MSLSAVIATMNRPDDLKKALDSLAAQTRPPDEVLIVDQSTDERTRRLAEECRAALGSRGTGLRYLYQEEKSLVKARNRALSETRHPIVSFLDDDIVLEPDYYEKVLGFLAAHPDVGAVSGNTFMRDPELKSFRWAVRRAILRIFLIDRFDGRMTASGLGHPIVDRKIDRTLFVEMLPGCNMTSRRDRIGELRFDEWFSGYGYREDAEFSYAVSRRTRLAMIPDAKLHHYYSTQNRLDEAALRRMSVRNYHYVARKHKRGPFVKTLFLYSLVGFLFIDLLELVAGSGGPAKAEKLKAGLSAIRETLKAPSAGGRERP